MASRHFKCDFSHSEKAFFCAVNAIFDKVLLIRVATDLDQVYAHSALWFGIINIRGNNGCVKRLQRQKTQPDKDRTQLKTTTATRQVHVLAYT